ncbi:grasp-with-spasm system ATP-grasp peptide maturase [Tenacibaculum xiamenense]|uniref:grasp-with-spasm system ATP-grasp peptide maturase n=1 Tax=Tenacibaculum xiamenense TaxID=1261553 RepID=UPI003894B249
MILIISSEKDITTHIVIQWLKKYNADFLFIKTEDLSSLNSFSIDNTSEKLTINNVDFSTINVVWHRRGRLKFLDSSSLNNSNLFLYLKREEDSVIKSLENFQRSTSKAYIGSYIKEVENFKLDHLSLAKKCGFRIPKTLVTTSKKELLHFKLENNKIITKDLRYPVNVQITKDTYLSSKGTLLIDDSDIELLDDKFMPIFVQEYIEKLFEIRVFFYDSTLFSMAIFSQEDEKTIIDYRNYNDEKPNRCIPFKLPDLIKDKILKFSNESNINTGSIDLIFSSEEEFIFLEINPMGQLDWLSKNCNYYIEKEIATSLILKNA